MSETQRLEIQEIGDVTVVRFRDPRVTNPMEIDEVGRQLYRRCWRSRTAQSGRRFFARGVHLQRMIGKLISLNRKAKVCKSAVRLCNMRPEIRDIFHLCNLERVFDIREDQAAAIASF